jgi:DNA-binding PucR family transcriptional regulator
MPQTRRYQTNAARQAAYRQRQQAQCAAEQQQRGLPPLPTIPSLPGSARWRAALLMASGLLSDVCSQMQDYYEARSERWQHSEPAEAFTERLDELTQLSEQLETLL